MQTLPQLLPVLEELKAREPIFHQPELGTSHADLAAQTAPDFWEVGASGTCYSRDFILDTVARRYRDNLPDGAETWRSSDFYCRQLGPDTYMLTYLLDQAGRLSRRLTLWQRSSEHGWQILYHQGTLVIA